jgi:hypothetical protein
MLKYGDDSIFKNGIWLEEGIYINLCERVPKLYDTLRPFGLDDIRGFSKFIFGDAQAVVFPWSSLQPTQLLLGCIFLLSLP